MGRKMEQKNIHICEVCGKTEVLTSDEAYLQGWDYPPRMGKFGIVSPRTCGNCVITDTFWWALQSGKVKSMSDLSDHQKEVLARIQNEPASIIPAE